MILFSIGLMTGVILMVVLQIGRAYHECADEMALCECLQCGYEVVTIPGSRCSCGQKMKPCDVGQG